MIFVAAVITTPAAVRRRLQERRPPGRWVLPTLLGVVVLAVLIAPTYHGYVRVRERLTSHPLSEVREWFEAEVPRGSFVVTEVGTRLLGVTDVAVLHPEVRAAFQEASDRPVFAVQLIPLFQVAPERSAIFYDLSLYEMADYVVTVTSVRARYEKDATRF